VDVAYVLPEDMNLGLAYYQRSLPISRFPARGRRRTPAPGASGSDADRWLELPGLDVRPVGLRLSAYGRLMRMSIWRRSQRLRRCCGCG
jgi:hypothetical protein